MAKGRRRRQPGSPEWNAHISSLLADESKQPLCWWWLSFAEDGFRGAAITQERGPTLALRKTHRLRINPGVEVATWNLGPDLPPNLPLSMTDRLLTKADIEFIETLGPPVASAQCEAE